MAYKAPLNLNLKKGALHEALGMGMDKKIPMGKLEMAKNSNSPLMRKRAAFAMNARNWNHGK